ncbi:CoA transferase [Prauserella flavalba]|uniref:Mesaconyl-CoA isomerase n=1 Tax=Prauserella flavalba TaxID=1477506 RepID=A0A318LX76_9PSEU|nr:CoA transferase [Prauserella flavalba]PXY36838.1 mesaconyl-CoA isomerase [Prauserella flavalba]
MTAPLEGLRVLELSSFVASPLGGMTLAQLGADVIRVDPVGGGPDRHRWPLAPGGGSLYWAGLNQGKRSVTVDLRSAEGAELVGDLVESSGPEGGIVLTNARPRPGLTYEELSARRPDLIHVHLLGRRDGGTAVDYTVNAATGFACVTGPEDHAGPVNHVLPAWDVATGLYLAVGLLAAERRRARTGRGEQLTVSLQDVALATAGNLGYLAEAQLSSSPRPRIGNHVYGDFGRDFPTRDGERIMVLVLTNRHWRDLLDMTGTAAPLGALEERLGADFTHGADRYRHRELIGGLLSPWFAERTCEQAEAALGATSALWSRYRTFADVARDDDGTLKTHPLMNTLTQPGIGSYLAPGLPVVFGGEQTPATPAPRLGEHTDQVLGELLGLSPARLDGLRARGVIGEPHD